MAVFDISEYLAGNTYPGRGVGIGLTPDGKKSVVVYFIMGRSVNSRNRVFMACDDGIRTQAFDESKLTDPSLIIYHPVRICGDKLIVTNGDQTDTIVEFLRAGKGFEEALNTRTFEPDAPNYTPRISGILAADGAYKLSILKSDAGNAASVQRFYFDYTQPVAGEGHLIHTYNEDGDPIPSFTGEPEHFATQADIDVFTGHVWDCLDEENRVSLYVCYRDLSSGETEVRIVNKNQ